MIAPDQTIFIVMALALLVLNWFAFRADANAAGHDRRQMLKMAAIWVTIFAVVTGVIILIGGKPS